MMHQIPEITKFLGYALPFLNRETTEQKIVAYRHPRGMSQKKLAIQLRVDSSTLGRWERDGSFPTGKLKLRLEPFFGEILSGGGRTKR